MKWLAGFQRNPIRVDWGRVNCKWKLIKGRLMWVSGWVNTWMGWSSHSVTPLTKSFARPTHTLDLVTHSATLVPYRSLFVWKSFDGLVAPLKEGPIVVKPSLTSYDPRCAYLSAVACSFSAHPTAADLRRSRSLPHGCTSLKNHGPRREMRIWPLKAILWTGRVANVTAHVCLSPVMKWIWVGAYSVSKAKVAFPRFIRVLFL